jgi:hypothetical protein
MKNVTSYLANGCPKTCWGCGQPFVVREGRAEAIVSASGRLYCHRNGCEETALLSHVCASQRPNAINSCGIRRANVWFAVSQELA